MEGRAGGDLLEQEMSPDRPVMLPFGEPGARAKEAVDGAAFFEEIGPADGPKLRNGLPAMCGLIS